MSEIFRLHVGGIHQLDQDDDLMRKKLTKKFQKFGRVQDLEIKAKRDIDGNIVNRFAFLSLLANKVKAKMCVDSYNGSLLQGCHLSVAFAKEPFLQRLKREQALNQVAPVLLNTSATLEAALPPVHSDKHTCKIGDNSQPLPPVAVLPNGDSARGPDQSSLLNSSTLKPEAVKREKKKKAKKRSSTKESDDKRQQGIQQQQERLQKQRNVVQQALQSKLLVNQRIVFESSSDESDDGVSGCITPSVEEKTATPRYSMALFNADKDSGVVTNNDFTVKPQFEGASGQKLLELQAGFDDARFKLDARFHDSDDDTGSPDGVVNSAAADSLNEEKQRNLQILQGIVGVKQVLSVPSRKRDEKSVSNMLRFDPSLSQHNVYELPENRTLNEDDSIKLKKPSADRKLDHTKLSHNKFYSVSKNLKETLIGSDSRDGRSTTFKLSNLFNNAGGEVAAAAGGTEEVVTTAVESHTVADTGTDHEGMATPHHGITPPSNDGSQASTHPPQCFFFTKNDPRFQIGYDFFFGNLRSKEEIREEWLKKRSNLQEIYRTRRKRTLKRKKQLHQSQKKSLFHSSHKFPQKSSRR